MVKGEQEVVKLRAAFWYQNALPELTGLPKIKLEKRMQELQTLLAGAAAAAVQPTGISEETRKAMPTDAELKNLKDLGVGEKNGDQAKRQEFYRLRNSIV